MFAAFVNPSVPAPRLQNRPPVLAVATVTGPAKFNTADGLLTLIVSRMLPPSVRPTEPLVVAGPAPV